MSQTSWPHAGVRHGVAAAALLTPNHPSTASRLRQQQTPGTLRLHTLLKRSFLDGIVKKLVTTSIRVRSNRFPTGIVQHLRQYPHQRHENEGTATAATANFDDWLTPNYDLELHKSFIRASRPHKLLVVRFLKHSMNHKSVSIELHRRSCARVEPPTSTISYCQTV